MNPPTEEPQARPNRHQGRLHWWWWAIMGIAVVVALVVAGGVPDAQRSDEVRLHEVALKLRCLQCAGESVAGSQSPLAEQFRAEIAAQIDEGASDSQIVDYFVESYGEEVLLEPSTSGVSLLIWVLPVAAVVIAVGGLAFAFRRWRATPEADDPDADDPVADAVQQGADTVSSAPAGTASVDADATESAQVAGADNSGRSVLRPVLIGAGTITFIALTAWLVAWGSDDRGGGELTGSTGTVSGELARCQPLAREDPAAAIDCYDGVLEMDPGNATALTYRGWANLRADEREAGLDDLNAAIEADDSLADPHVFLAVDAVDTGDFETAAAEMALFWSKDPSEVAVSVVQSQGLEREVFFGLMGEPTRQCWQQAASGGGDRELDQAFLDDLGACLDAVLAADPTDQDAMLSRAMAYIGPEKSDPEAARTLVDRLLSADPDNADAVALAAMLDLSAGDRDAAADGLARLEALPRGPAAFLIGDADLIAQGLAATEPESDG